MEHKDVFLLEIIIEFCDKILAVVKDLNENQATFLEDYRAQDLCCFYILQIGENVSHLSSTFTNAHPEIAWHKISGFRNTVAHEYGNVEPEIVWKTITTDIPELRNFCVKLIS